MGDLSWEHKTYKVNPSSTTVVTAGTGAGVGQYSNWADDAYILQNVSQHGGVSVGFQNIGSTKVPIVMVGGVFVAQLL